MVRNQVARRNISTYFKSTQALKMVERLEALGRQNMSEGAIKARSNGTNNGSPEMANHSKQENDTAHSDAWQYAAKTYGTSRGSMTNAKKLDDDDAPPELRAKVKSGDVSLTRAAGNTHGPSSDF
jgi:hypothetical protein